jgi:hypothetical protein
MEKPLLTKQGQNTMAKSSQLFTKLTGIDSLNPWI